MIDEIKSRKNLDLQPQDLAQSYVEPSFNHGSAGLSQIIGNPLGSTSTFEPPIFHPGALGARTTPGDQDFAYADTPQATVFVQKKQWVEQEWVYVTDDTIERKGKIQEELLKIAYANLISRKLDLLNEHELMTKFSDSSPKIPEILQSAAGGVQTRLNYAEKLNPDQLANLLTSAGNPVTKYYTEQIILKDPDQTTPPIPPKEIKGEYTFKIANKIKVTTKDKAIDASRLRIRISPESAIYLTGIRKGQTVETTGKVIKGFGLGGIVYKNVAERPDNLPLDNFAVKTIADKYPLEEWWEIDLTKLKLSQLVLNKNAGSGDPKLDTLEKIIAASNGGVGYVPRYNPNNKEEQFAEPVDPLEDAKETVVLETIAGVEAKTTKGKEYGTFQNVFNGVIELANINNVSTSINNSGNPGSANFQLENPNNLLTISEDDIEIALGTYNLEDERFYTEEEIQQASNPDSKIKSPKNYTYTDPLTKQELTLYNHNGKFYTKRAYQLVTNKSLGAKANFSTSGEIVKLQTHLAILQAHITNLDLYRGTGKIKSLKAEEINAQPKTKFSTEDSLQYVSYLDNSIDSSKYPEIEKIPVTTFLNLNFPFPSETSYFGVPTEQYDLGFAFNKTKVKEKIEQLINRRAAVLNTINNLMSSGNATPIASNDPEVNYRRSQLRKYFLNRTVFEVYDRVFIWMTSPSRTSFKLNDGTIVSEAPSFDLSTQLQIQKIQEIISLIKQLNSTILKIAQQANKTIQPLFTDQELTEINQELFQDGLSFIYDKKSKMILENFNDAPTYVDQFVNFISSKFDQDNKPTPDPTINILNQAIKQKISELATLKQSFASSEDQKTKAQENKATEAISSFDPSIFSLAPKFAGVDEQQIQVFQGVITKISRNYSQGQFKISISCQDNLEFLSRSRFTMKPALQTSFREARAELDDPIYREVRNKPATDELKNKTSIPHFTGRWKTGILSTSARILTAKDEDLKAKAEAKGQQLESSSEAIPETEKIKAGLPNNYAFVEPFLGADPATIVSLLVTGMPFDISSYILNTVFGGSFNKKATSSNNEFKDGEVIPSGPIEEVRKQILGQLRRFGDFEPYIDRKKTKSPKVSEESKKNISVASATTLAAAIAAFARIYVSSRKDIMSSAYQTIQSGVQNQTSFWKNVNKDNASTILQDIETLPYERNQIKINSNVLGDPKIDFFIKAAIKGIDSNQINTALKEKDSKKLKALVEDTPQQVIDELVKDSDKYALKSGTSSDISIYAGVLDTANARIRRGVFFKLANGNKDDFKDLLKPKPDSVSEQQDIAIRKVVAQLRNTELDEEGKFITSGTPLQATKPSIMFKQKNNYLVVSDEYYKSPNLIDYVEKISNPNQHFIDEYKRVIDRCKDAARKIDWEFYADSQGHIRFKEPTYNRTLLKHLLEIKNADAILKSSFIELFEEYELNGAQKILVYKKYISLLEQIKLQALDRIQSLIEQSSQIPIPQKPFSASAILGLNLQPLNILQYLLEEDLIPRNRLRQIRALIRLKGLSSGEIESQNEKQLRYTKQQLLDEAKKEADQFNQETKQQPSFTNSSTLNLVTLLPLKEEPGLPSEQQYIDDQIAKYQEKIKQPAGTLTAQVSQAFLGVDVDEESLSEDIATHIENCVSACILAIEVVEEFKKNITELEQEFSNLLQDVTDERFIHVISNSIIVEESYSEDSPTFTRLDVYSQGAVPSKGTFSSETENEAVLWAGAVDYDMWRLYGYIPSDKLEAPFLKTSGQAVLYGYQLMARQYSKTLSGAISVRGDSKYQLGDTVFIEDENLYFYITEVSHNFTYGGEYKTNLRLEYGRRPGYYIPYPFNLLGGRLTSAINRLYGTEAGDITQIIKQFNNEQQAKSEQNAEQ